MNESTPRTQTTDNLRQIYSPLRIKGSSFQAGNPEEPQPQNMAVRRIKIKRSKNREDQKPHKIQNK